MLNKAEIQEWASLVSLAICSGVCSCGRSWSPPVPLYQLNWASEQDFSLWEWHARMRLGVLPQLCFALQSRLGSHSPTPQSWVSANTSIVLSCPMVLNCKVHIWLWMLFPKNQSCSDSIFVWRLCRRGQSWYTTNASCLPRQNPTLQTVIPPGSQETITETSNVLWSWTYANCSVLAVC